MQAYGATNSAEFAPKETGTLERIGRRLSADEQLDAQDLEVLRRLTVYVGLIARGVAKDEAREVASYVPSAPDSDPQGERNKRDTPTPAR